MKKIYQYLIHQLVLPIFVSQLEPVKPGTQSHVAVFIPSTQVPPFWQVTDEQSSEKKLRNYYMETQVHVVNNDTGHVQYKFSFWDPGQFSKYLDP